MRGLADAMQEHAQELAQIESLDNGKPVGLAQYVDVNGAIAHLRYFAGWPTKIEGAVLPVSAPDMLCYTRREPVGVCAQIVPWNFPLLIAIWKLAPRQILRAERRLCGHVSGGPREVSFQRCARISAPMVPPPVKNSRLLTGSTWTGSDPLFGEPAASGIKGLADMAGSVAVRPQVLSMTVKKAVSALLQSQL